MRLWFFILSLGFMALGLCLPANAASFDCSKAASAFEKAICADPDLSASDDTLAVAYATATGGLSQKAADAMRAGQRAWLKSLDVTCADAMLPGDNPAAEERATCLKTAYTARIATLEASRMYSGLRFYNEDDYRAGRDPTGEGYYKVATHMQSLPRLDGGSAAARAFNAFVDKAAPDLAGSFAAPPADDEKSSDTELKVTVKRVTTNRIELAVNSYWYGHGAAHGNYAITYLNFLRNENRGLAAADIFAGKDWQQHLADLVLKQLVADRGELDWDIDAAWLKETVADPERWELSPDGFTMQFQPYEVASYAEGAVTVTIGWDKLTDDLAEGAEQLVVYDY
jgi:uncharacterized protein